MNRYREISDVFYSLYGSISTDVLALKTAPDISMNSNFNSLVAVGNYRVRSYSDSATMSNIPVQTAGTLYVKNSMLENGANYKQQIYVTHQNVIYLRYTSDNGSTWSNWDSLALDSNTSILKNKAITVTAQDYNTLPTGLIYNAEVGANCPTTTGYLLVMTYEIANGAASQIAFDMYPSVSRIFFRTRTAQIWRPWEELSANTKRLWNGYVGQSRTNTYTLEGNSAYLLTVSSVSASNIVECFAAIVSTPSDNDHTGIIKWIGEAPTNAKLHITTSGTTLSVVSDSGYWLQYSLTKL